MEKRNKNLLIIGGVIFIFFLLVFLIPDTETKPLGVEKPAKTSYQFSDDYDLSKKEMSEVLNLMVEETSWETMESEFMKACNVNGDIREYCQCCFNNIKNTYSKEEYLNISFQIVDTGSAPEGVLVEMMKGCTNKLY